MLVTAQARIRTDYDNKRITPILWMLSSVANYAPLALLTWIAVKDASPLLVVGVWYVITAVVEIAMTQTAARRSRSGNSWISHLKSIPRKHLAALILCQFDWLMFAAAMTLADALIVTMVTEFWPMILAAAMLLPVYKRSAGHVLNPGEGRSSVQVISWMLVGGLGVMLTLFSEQGTLTVWTAASFGGALLAASAALLGALGVLFMVLIGQAASSTASSATEATQVSIAANAIGQFLIGVAIILAAAVLGHADDISASTMLIAVCLGILNSLAKWSLMRSSHAAVSVSAKFAAQINGMLYATPVLSLVLLTVFGASEIMHPAVFAVGAGIVIAANVAMHARAQPPPEQNLPLPASSDTPACGREADRGLPM